MSAAGGRLLPAPSGSSGDAGVDPLEVLYQAETLPAYDLPEQLQVAYGGPLGFAEPRLVANFVTSLDGVVALPGLPRSTKLLGDGSTADRFLLGLLRACADVVLLGAGTLHAHPDTLWTGQRAHRPAAAGYAELRRRRQQPPDPQLAVVTATGDLDVDHPALREGALVLTSEHGADALAGQLPAACAVLVAGRGTTVDLRAALGVLHERGHRLVVSEAGPHLFGSLLAADLADELFLTQSPLLAGRGASTRLGLVEGATLLPDLRRDARLLSVRRSAGHLFLRYERHPTGPIRRPAAPDAGEHQHRRDDR